MKFTIKKDLLNEKLNIVSKALSTKNIYPILCGIKLDLKSEGLFFTTSNEDICIETFIPSSNIDNFNEEGSIVIPGKYFIELIRKIDDDLINFVTDGLNILISTKRGEYSLNGMNPQDFPPIKMDLLQNPIIIKQKELKTIINQTSFAISTQESRQVLTGVNFQIHDNILECTATDSYRVSKKKIQLNNENHDNVNIVIPGKNLIELTKILFDDDNDIELHIFQNNVLFKTNDILFQSRLLANTYPDTSKLIPDNFELILRIKLNDFFNTLDRVSLLTSDRDKNLIKMEINENNLTLISNSQEIGKMEETIQVEKSSNINMTINYSSKFMIDALKILKCDNIEIMLNGEIKPIIIKNVDDDSLIQLIVPILSV